MLRVLHFAGLLLAVFALPAAGTAFAQTAPANPPAPSFEVYTGVSGADAGISAYASVVWSMTGPVTEQGWRLRSGAELATSRDKLVAGDDRVTVKIKSKKTGADIALGYQADLQFLWLKVYGGGVFRDETITRDGQPMESGGARFGGVTAVESWWRLGGGFWSSLDLKWTSLDNGVSMFSRLGYSTATTENWPGLGVGLEAAIYADDIDAMSRKGGVFIQGLWGFHELTLSGGASQADENDDWDAYAAMSYGYKF